MTRINRQKAIEYIMVELEKGSTYSDCLDVIGRNWTLSESSFKRYWKEANEAYTDQQKAIQDELMKDNTEAAKERLKKAILTKDERMEIASKIAKGEAWKVKDELIIPSAGDRLRALDYLSKVDGDYAPNKMEIIAPEPITFTILRKDEQ